MTKRLTKAENAVLEDHLARLRAETTADGLEAAFQLDGFWMRYGTFTPSWRRIMTTLRDAGHAIVDAHPLGRYVPREGPRRRLDLLGGTYRVGRGENSAGVRYAWHSAGEWALRLYREEGLSTTAAHTLWDSSWRDYPHRTLGLVEKAVAGGMPDPDLDVLIAHGRKGGSPIRHSVEQNDGPDGDHRHSRLCPCGKGTLFDWGGGDAKGFMFINMHCNACPEVYTVYMTQAGFMAMRQAGARRREQLRAATLAA